MVALLHCCTVALLHCKMVTLIDDEDDVSSMCWQFEVIHCPDLACTVMILSANQAADLFIQCFYNSSLWDE